MSGARRVRYHTADVFTDRAFGGNQLAVFPDAREIPESRLLDVTREFNYSETVFVYPAAHPAHTRRLRIFTPGGEVPFAGHPTVGTAHVLAETGAIPLAGDTTRVVFEEGVGPVPVTIRAAAGRPTFAQLSVAQLPEIGPPPPSRADLAAVLSLDEADLLDGVEGPEAVSCGLPFLVVPLRHHAALRRARVRIDHWEAALAGAWASMILVVTRDAAGLDVDLRARMFAPGISIPEDPATGSACAALGGYLARRESARTGTLRWVVAQGIEMGRPSRLDVEADVAAGATTAVRVGGASVLVCEGTMAIPAA